MGTGENTPGTALEARTALAHYPEGARIEQIEQRLAAASSRRSLQRWLKALIAQGQVRRAGQGRAVVYLRRVVVEAQFHAAGTSRAVAYGEATIPLSPEARAIEQQVRQPLALRQPVGYQRAFLDAYRPNETYYLSQTLRDELLSQGQASSGHEPVSYTHLTLPTN